ncbi:hypothetical protein D9M73_112660 [compost metagenome]
MRDIQPLRPRTAHRLMDWPEGRAPADDRELARGFAEFDDLIGHRDIGDLVAADVGHLLVVFSTVIEVAGADRFLDPADAVEQARRAGLYPRTLQFLIAAIGQEFPLVRIFGCELVLHFLLAGKLNRERRIAAHIRHQPRLGGVGDIAVGQQHHWRHILHRDPHCFDRAIEAVGRRTRGDHRHRRIAIAAIDRLIEVRLLGLGGEAGRRATALRIDDDERQLGHDRQTHRFALQRDTRPRGGGDAKLPGIRRADRRGDRGDLILGLEGGDAIFLQARQEMQDRRGGRYRIAAEEHRHVRQLHACHQPERDRLGTGDGAVQARLCRSDADVVLLHRSGQLGGLAISVPGVQRGDIGLGQHRGLGEFRLKPVDDRLPVAVEHPQRQTQRPHVLAAQRFLVAKAERLDRVERQLRDVEAQQLPFGEATIGERIGGVLCLGEVAFAKFAFVGDDQATGLQLANVHLQRRRVHRDQHVGRIASRVHSGRPEIDLEGGDAEQRALRRANFCGEIGEGREIVAGKRGGQRELPPGQLHPIARIARKPDDNRFSKRVGGGFLGGHFMRGGRHYVCPAGYRCHAPYASEGGGPR